MNEIEYAFGTGDGTVDVWSTQADLELAGSPDAVRLDFDGDGLIDDALWDTQGDGVADVAALDLNDDGVLDAFFTDPSGHGVWDHQITGSTADAASEPLDWIVRGEGRPVADAPDSPAGYETSHPAPPPDPVTGQAPPQLMPPVDPFVRPDVQPGNPAGLVVQFNLEVQVNASLGQPQTPADPAGFAAGEQP